MLEGSAQNTSKVLKQYIEDKFSKATCSELRT